MERIEYHVADIAHPRSNQPEDDVDQEYGPSLFIPPTDEKPANVVSSLADDGMHYPALDIDIPCRFVPSSTPGHGHLYFDTIALTWDGYRALLHALTAAGIIEPGYLAVSLEREQTLLRKPGIMRFDPRTPDVPATPIDPDSPF